MMTAKEHIAEAEDDVERANEATIEDGMAGFFLSRAQAHALIATAISTEESLL